MANSQAAKSQSVWGRMARRIRVPLAFVFAIFYFWRARPTWRFLLLGALIAGLVLCCAFWPRDR